MKARCGHPHRHRLATDRSEMVKLDRVLVRRSGALFERADDVATLHIVAGERHLGDSYVRMNFHDMDLAKVRIGGAHRPHQLELPLEPRNLYRLRYRSDNRETVA